MKAHPYADQFPMLGEDELAELVESIRANGLRNPIVVTTDGLILDGRNRAAACEAAGIEPTTVVYEGDDLAEYVIDCNVTRRNMTTGARAMSTALVLAADGRREGGRWKRDSLTNGSSSDSADDSAWLKALRQAGVVLDYRPDLAPFVVDGTATLHDAYQQADHVRRSADAEKLAEKARRRAEAEQAKAEAERNEQIIRDLTDAQATKYLGLIESGDFTPPAAWAAYQEETRKERERSKEIERGIRDTNNRIAECVRSLAAHAPGDLLVSGFMPHHERVVVEGMRLTAARCEDAITVLQALIKELNR